MTLVHARPLFHAAAVAVAALGLSWFAGGQAALGRIDPALALPLLPCPALFLSWLQRRRAARARWQAAGAALAMILVAQALLALLLSTRLPWVQLGLVAAGWILVTASADALIRWSRGRALALLLSALLVAGWFAGGHALLAALYRQPAAPGPPATMLTGLPLRWSEGDDIGAMLDRGLNEDPALLRLRAAGPVRLVDSIVDEPPAPDGTLLLAHPRALAPQELVAIDGFVRGGRRVVILADALTGWPPRHPIGDPRNPPVTSLLTPLLDHWGIELGAAAPTRLDEPVDVAGARLRLFSAGRFERLPPTCRAMAGGYIARCTIAKGEAWLVGDADLLFDPLWAPRPRWAAHLRRADTMEWLARRLWPGARQPVLQPLWIRTAAE